MNLTDTINALGVALGEAPIRAPDYIESVVRKPDLALLTPQEREWLAQAEAGEQS